ncbi:hypothetical protein B0A55_05262 [Friedmanniomyces simplex]|uniref:RNA helicase n=1 Tax=Friedmanniomyces simplex TaxID=329884 RepID=A0A4U0XH47_9PEZI|nr:hypothetical protein B0A55_05262 [Friedmanniomyces simplex]
MAKYVPRERKHKRLAKRSQTQVQASAQPAPDEIIPESKTERETRRTKIAEEVRSQQPLSKVSSKKRKRLDKYVDTKLRKEENLDLLKKLAAHKVDTSLLQSSKKLGRVLETKRERFSRALREKQAGIDDGRHDDVLYERRREMPPVGEDEDGDGSEDEDDEVSAIAPTAVEPKAALGFGSGLKRPLDTDGSGQPVIKKRKRRRKVVLRSPASPKYSEDDEDSAEGTYDDRDLDESDDEDEWHGFGSDAEVERQDKTKALSGNAIDPDERVEGSSASEDEVDSEQDEDSSAEEDVDEETDSESAPSAGSDRKERVSAFKQWANTQRNTALDFTPSALPTESATVKANFKPRQPSPDPDVPALNEKEATFSLTNGERSSRPSAAITIPRSEEIQVARLDLPVVQEEQRIMEAIHGNPIVIVCGATGSGKTTQVPQMMFESGYGSHIGMQSKSSAGPGPQSKGMIGVTQPRRVAATSVAERVATELGPAYRNRVAHQVRYDTNVSRDTAIKFMTDGILLRDISQDFLLSRYSAIVIDEAHERSVNTDILIGMLSRIVPLRAELAREEPEKHYPLKLIIMSATLRVADFVENRRLFRDGPPPIVEAEGRQYPVTVHFSRRTQREYAAETVEKVARGHRKLPPGGILVFLTSQSEIQDVAKTAIVIDEAHERSVNTDILIGMLSRIVPLRAELAREEPEKHYPLKVAHQVRYDTNVSRDTAIKFMTDGILLREISQDFLLSRYSAIVIDEAHERSVNTDILIGMLSRIVPLRAELAREEPEKHYPLKLVIMSATLRVADFVENRRLFRDGPPPIVEAEGRQYPVTVHFSRRTQREYAAETVEKVTRGHRKLPPGGILVFLTSQSEIQDVAKTLRARLGSGTAGHVGSGRGAGGEEAPLDMDDFEDRNDLKRNNDYLDGEDNAVSDSDVEISGLDPDVDDQEFQVDDQPQFGTRQRGALKPHILPLYAALPSVQQLRVFQPPPDGSRLIVLATNVAETSLTIPGIRYVFDCGRAKEKRYDIATGVQTFEIDWISKASASQRMGRAGRTGPGHCYRLYSSAVYERDFAEHTVPEILRTPLESTVLQLKSMEIGSVVSFPFPTSPDAVQLVQAERLLRTLGAIGKEEEGGRITEMGREVLRFPINPRFGKMLLLAQRNSVPAYTVAVVAGLAVGDLFVPEAQSGSGNLLLESESDEDSDRDARRERKLAEGEAHTAAQQRHQAYTRAQATLSRWDDQSDALKLLTAVAVHADAAGPRKPLTAASKICADYYLREKGMSEVQQLRHQLHNIVSARYPAATGTFKDALPVPSEKERKMLGQVVAAAYIDQVAIRADLLTDETTSGFGRKPRRAVEVAYRTLVPTADVDKTLSPQEQETQRSVFVHPSSVLAHLSVKEMPGYIVYSNLSRAAPSTVDSGKTPRTRMHPLTVVGAKVIAALAEGTPLLEMGKPIGKIEELGGGRRQCWVSLGLRAPGGNSSWPLSAWKVVQRKGKRGEWEVEKVVAR